MVDYVVPTTNIKTVFSVDGDSYAVNGHGQDAVSSMLKSYPNKKVFFLGFLIDNKFVKANLSMSY